MYLAIIKQYECPAFPDGLQYLDFKSKRQLFEYLGTLRLIDTPYIAIELKKSDARVVDWFKEKEVAKALKERSKDEE